MHLFAYDCLVNREVKDVKDSSALRRDLYNIQLWCQKWRMTLNLEKTAHTWRGGDMRWRRLTSRNIYCTFGLVMCCNEHVFQWLTSTSWSFNFLERSFLITKTSRRKSFLSLGCPSRPISKPVTERVSSQVIPSQANQRNKWDVGRNFELHRASSCEFSFEVESSTCAICGNLWWLFSFCFCLNLTYPYISQCMESKRLKFIVIFWCYKCCVDIVCSSPLNLRNTQQLLWPIHH